VSQSVRYDTLETFQHRGPGVSVLSGTSKIVVQPRKRHVSSIALSVVFVTIVAVVMVFIRSPPQFRVL
jgi:hypothetical protein